jgi:hypothetical protein
MDCPLENHLALSQSPLYRITDDFRNTVHFNFILFKTVYQSILFRNEGATKHLPN